MTVAQSGICTFQQEKDLINQYDYSAVVDRLVFIEKWSKSDAIEALQQYKNFIFLKKMYGNEHALPPSDDIDEVWHAHILHTEDYEKFCKQVFGYFLHHKPHMSQEAGSLQELAVLFQKTQELHLLEFGEYIYAVRDKSFFERVINFFRRWVVKENDRAEGLGLTE